MNLLFLDVCGAFQQKETYCNCMINYLSLLKICSNLDYSQKYLN